LIRVGTSQKRFEACGELIQRGYALKADVQTPTTQSVVEQATRLFGGDLRTRIKLRADSVTPPSSILSKRFLPLSRKPPR
jgi:hypothetical protein